jgi:pimeloyl-ACP methyl ester carboxylesterase
MQVRTFKRRYSSSRKRLVQVPHCGHLSEQDAPDAIMDAVIEFFDLHPVGNGIAKSSR